MYICAAQFMGIDLQKPYLEAQIEVLNGSLKDYPSNGINFASAGSGVLQATNRDLVRNKNHTLFHGIWSNTIHEYLIKCFNSQF